MEKIEKEMILYYILEIIEPKISNKSFNPSIEEQNYIKEQLNLMIEPMEKIEKICEKIKKRSKKNEKDKSKP